MLDELKNACKPGMVGGFLPGVKQIANVAALPGIVGRSVGLPDVHSGYGFAIGWCTRLLRALTNYFQITIKNFLQAIWLHLTLTIHSR